jgi:excisionase family DNA binding protein
MTGKKTVTTTHSRFTVDGETSEKQILMMQAPYEEIVSVHDAETGKRLEQYYTVPEVAGKLKMDERTIRSWIESGKIKGIKIGRHYRISESALIKTLEESKL